MAKKSERRNKKDPNALGGKGSTMNGDDSSNSKSAVKPNIHEKRTIQKNNSNK